MLNWAEAFGGVRAPFLVAPGGARDPPGGFGDPPGRLFQVPEGVLLIQHGVHQKSDEKVPKC